MHHQCTCGFLNSDFDITEIHPTILFQKASLLIANSFIDTLSLCASFVCWFAEIMQG